MYSSEIENCLSKEQFDSTHISNLLINQFYQEIVSEQSQQILNVAFNDQLKQEDLDKFFKTWDIEENTAKKAILIAYTMKERSDLSFPNNVKPRLSGLLRYHRFANLQLLSHFTKICKELNKQNIFPMILKGGAMKYLRQDLPRVMGDIDILIHMNEYAKACEVARNLGYFFVEKKEMHSIDLHLSETDESGILDIHRWIDFNSKYNHRYTDTFFSRAHKKKVFGADVYVPCPEDIVFIALVNMSKNLTKKTSMNGILYTLFDCKFLLNKNKNFNWNIVLENAKNTNTQLHLYFSIRFIHKIAPSIFPDEIVQNNYLQKQFEDYCYKLMYYRFYLSDIRTVCRSMPIGKAIKSPKMMFNYIRLKPIYVTLKMFRNNVWMIKKLLNNIKINIKHK